MKKTPFDRYELRGQKTPEGEAEVLMMSDVRAGEDVEMVRASAVSRILEQYPSATFEPGMTPHSMGTFLAPETDEEEIELAKKFW